MMILRIDSCGECPFSQDYLKCQKSSGTPYPVPDDCPLRPMEVTGLPDYIEKEQRVIAMIPKELVDIMEEE